MGIFAPDGKLAGFLNALGNLIVLNILTLICSIPIFTFGASMTALYTMVMRMARKEDGKIISEYFKAFKANFKQATILWLIFGGLIGFMTFDIWLLRSITGTFGTVYRVILFVIILIFAMVLIHIFAVLARFDNTIKNTAKNALAVLRRQTSAGSSDADTDTDPGNSSDSILSFHIGRFPDRIIGTGISCSNLFCRSI